MIVLSVETPEPNVRRLRIAIPSEELKSAVDDAFENVRANAQIPGFRRNKVPRNILRARFGKAVEADAIQNLVPTACMDAVEERELKVVGDITVDPTLDEMSIKEGEDLTFALDVEVRPSIAVPDYRVFEVDKTAVDVPREDVDRYIEYLRGERATFEELGEERTVTEDDVVDVDWVVRNPRSDEVLQEREDDRIDMAGERTWDHLKDALTGMPMGETKQLTVPLSTQGADGGSSGPESVELTVTTKRLMRKILPEIDEAFAKDLNFPDVDQMRTRVWDELIERKKANQRSEQERDLRDQLIERTEFDVPARAVEQRRENLIAGMYGGQGAPPTLESQEAESLTKAAERLVREEWVLEEIALAEDITASDAETDGFIRERGQARGADPEEFLAEMRQREMVDYYRNLARESKVYEFLIEQAAQKSTLVIG